MKVLFITNIPAPYRIDFYNQLGKIIDLTVIFEAKGAEGIKFNWNIDEIKNFKAIFLSEGNINEKKINWKIFKYIKKNQYDHIVATSYSYFTEMAALIFMKINRIPYYYETDGGMIRDENIIKRIYKRFLISNAKGYFSPSIESDKYLKFYGAKFDKIHRYPFTSLHQNEILNKIISEDEKDKLREKLGIKEKKIILSVGQFIYRKGYDILLEACKDLSKEVGVYIIGGEATEEYIKLKKSLNLDNVYFKEFKEKANLAEYYKLADIFILPTREDIWGLVINEAMAYGLPIITTNKCIAGLQLVSNDYNGYIVNSEDSYSLREKINVLLNESDKIKSFSKNSLNKINEYTIENMCNAHIKVFKSSN